MHREDEWIQAAHASHLKIRIQRAANHKGFIDDFGMKIVTDRPVRLGLPLAQLKNVLREFTAEVQPVFSDVSKIDSHPMVWDCL